jgi:polyadenylate-binding protein
MNRAGEVVKVEIVSEKNSEKSSAVVVYSSFLEAERAIQQLDGLELRGEAVEVRENTGFKVTRSSRKSNQVYVKNLPYSVTWQQLRDAFAPFGEVVRVDIPKDIDERSKGFGFLQFRTSLQAKKAIDKMNNAEFNGRKILVKHAQKKHKNR